MRIRLRLWQLVVLAMIVGGPTTQQSFAQSDQRSVVVGRQRIQADLTAAIADGRLTRIEQYDILLDARDLLSDADLLILQHTMNRLGEKYAAPSRSLREELAQRIGLKNESVDETVAATTTRAGSTNAENSNATETVAYEQLADSLGNVVAVSASEESPFQEEDLLPTGETVGTDGDTDGQIFFDDPAMAFENCGPWGGGGRLALLAHPFALAQCLPLDIRFSTAIESFKGPMDLDNQNGNFGTSFAINAGFIALKRWGIGLQGGASDILSNFHGTRLTGEKIRSQNFTTVGLFQRVPFGNGKTRWGFAYDWLHDDYFDSIRLGQWRVKLAYEWSCVNEIGLWANIPDRSDRARVDDGGGPYHFERFESVAQGNIYLRHFWENGAETTHWIGLAEQPGGFIVGSSGRLPMGNHLALIGNFNYITPSEGGVNGQDREMWQMAIGIEITPGCRTLGGRDRVNTPLLPLANNAAFAVRRTP